MLKSGSPNMVVAYIDESSKRCDCRWFYEGKISENTFELTSLEIASDIEPMPIYGGV